MEILKIDNIEDLQRYSEAEDIELIKFLFYASATILSNYGILSEPSKNEFENKKIHECLENQIKTKTKMKSIISELNKREDW